MNEASRPWLWGLVGAGIGLALVIVPLATGASLSDGLRVGTDSDAAQFIADELGRIAVTEGEGHDGQYNYLVARDPFGTGDHVDLADDPAYRLRRPLLGWLAGMFGAAPPSWVVVGLALWPAAGLAFAAAAAERIRHAVGAGMWTMLGVLANPGLLLSVQLRTSDTLVAAGGLWAIVWALAGRDGRSRAAASLAVLAKEVALAFSLALAWWHVRRGELGRAAGAVLVPAAVLGGWMAVIAATTGDPTSAKGNIGVPFAGMTEVAAGSGVDRWFGVAALAGVALALAGAFRTPHRLLRASIVPWLALAVVSSDVVWGDGNNAVRVFSPLLALGVLSIGARFSDRRAPIGTMAASPPDPA